MADDFEAFAAAVRSKQGSSLDADSAALKPQFGEGADYSKTAGHVLPIALQMMLTGGAGPLGRVGGAGLAGLLTHGLQHGVEPMMQGQPPDMSVGGAAVDMGLSAGPQALLETASPLLSAILGRGKALSEGKTAATEAADALAAKTVSADESAARAKASATSSAETAQGSVNREMVKHSEDALKNLSDAEVEKKVAEGLGPQSEIPKPITIETLTAATSPAQKASQKAVQSVFTGISNKWKQALTPFNDLPVESTLTDAASTIRENLAAENKTVSPSMSKLLKLAEGKADLPSDVKIGRSPVKFGSYGTTSAERTKLTQILKGGPTGTDLPKPVNVQSHLGLRDEFSRVIRDSKNPTDRRIAMNMVDAIDNDVEKVVPDSARAQITQLRDEWHQAKSTFSNAFRSRLFRASSPEQVAEAITTGAKTGKQMGHRTALLVNQMARESPEDLPLLRQSVASVIANSKDAAAEVGKMDPGVFKSLFPGSGFDDPKKWTEALRGQQNVQNLLSSPESLAKFNSMFEQGMGSLGARTKQAALDKAEQTLRGLPNRQAYLADALKGMETPAEAQLRGGMAGMKEPLLGRGLGNYMKHRFEYHTMLSMMTLGAAHSTGHSMDWAIVPLAYLGGSKAIGAALANPRVGKMYYNFLTSDGPSKAGFWLGRLAAASLAEGARSSD